jgi:hypothetical protein
MIEPREADWLAARERLGMAHSDQLPPESVAIAHLVDHAWLALRLVVDELRAETLHGRQLGFELLGNIDDEARALDDSQVNTEIVKDTGRMKRFAGNVCSGELAPETSILNEFGRGGVIRVSIFPVRCEQKGWSHLAEDGRHGPTMEQSRLEASIGEIKVLSPGVAENGIRCSRFGRAPFESSQRRWLSACQVKDSDLPAVLDQSDDGPSHAQLSIIGVRRNNQRVKHVEFH